MKEIGIYIHIPFCKQKCKYCDFVSFSDKEIYINDYIECILKELKSFSEKVELNYINGVDDLVKINTIYIGGGTPSIISEKYIEKIINEIKDNFNIMKNAEITIEINPGTVNKQKLQKYLEIGINRISLGLQSTDDELLKLLGRVHKYKDFEEIYKLAREVGFKNINVDLMLGLPSQSISVLEKSLDEIISKNPEHISVYSLIVEENTQMFNLVEKGELKLPNENLEREMYWKVKHILEKNGYNHYEISNFAKKGYESKHNTNCWNQCEYIGFGVSAHSYFNNVRYSNIYNLEKYIENLKNYEQEKNVIVYEKQDTESKMNEYMLLRFKKNRRD